MMQRKYGLMFLGLLLVCLALLGSLASARNASAQAPLPTQPAQQNPLARVVTDNDVNRVAKKLYCPVCPNTPLDVCETAACKDWRMQIREQLSAGWSDQQVMDFFVKQYGERVLAEPERGGFTSLVWTLPVLVSGAGLVAVWLILKSWRAGRRAAAQQPAAPAPQAVSREVLARIEAEIRQMD